MHIHHSNRLELLAGELAGLIASEPADPLVAERIVVPHRTMERWLRLEIARELGIAANLQFELPAAFAWSLLRDAVPALSEEQGFSPDTLRWHLFEMLPEFSTGADTAALREFLADEDELKRFELADKLAGIYDRCVNFRGDWIRDWESGKTPHWQARLWQSLADKVEERHWVHALDDFGKALASGSAPQDWPRRAFIFGVSALSPSYLHWLRQLAGKVELHVFLLNPSETYWSDLRTEREIRRRVQASNAEASGAEAQHFEEGNRLLAAWGRDGRNTFEELIAGEAQTRSLFTEATATSRLAALQGDIQEARTGAGEVNVPPDNSLQIHCCHSAMREAEVLHDHLRELLETHPDIEPADILILTPQPARYGPAIAAVFESEGEAEGRIPVALSRLAEADSPTARAFFDLLSLPGTRYGVEAMLAPLDSPALRARFEIEESNLSEIRDWVRQAGIRRNTASEGDCAPAMPGNTWRDGFDRLLIGYAAGDTDELSLNVAPCSIRQEGGFEAGEDDYATLGRFMTYCKAAFALSEKVVRPGDAEHWKLLLREVLKTFFDNGSRAGAYGSYDDRRKAADEYGEVAMLIENFAEQAGRIECHIPFAVVRKVIGEAASRPALGPVRLADSATIGRLAPGQILPAKIICAVGMNGSGFPRNPPRHTFDPVESDQPRPGDRDPRHEDRFAFLEALLAARSAFIVTYTGRGQRDDAEIPPSVVVDELRDYLVSRFPDAQQPGAGFRLEHPLQPFSARYFNKSAFSQSGALFSYSPTMLDAARILQDSKRESTNRFAEPLPEPDVSRRKISLNELERYFSNPAAGFLRERFSVWLGGEDEAVDEVEPLDLNGYEKWQLREEILTRTDENREDRVDDRNVKARLMASGKLPHGGFGDLVHDEARAAVDLLREALLPHAETLAVEPQYVDLNIGDFHLMGAIPYIGPKRMLWWRNGKQRPVDLIYIRLRQLAWIAAGNAPLPITAVWLHDKDGTEEVEFPAPNPQEESIHRWIGAWWRGLSQPLRFFPKSTVTYAKEFGKEGGSAKIALEKAKKVWHGGDPEREGPSERDDSANGVIWDLGEVEDPLDDDFRGLAESLLAPMFGSKMQ